MNSAEIRDLVSLLLAGDMSSEQHALLQDELKRSREARTAFREFMDLEAGLRTWAAESTGAASMGRPGSGPLRMRALRWGSLAAIAASIALVAVSWWIMRGTPNGTQARPPVQLGTLSQREDCRWQTPVDISSDSRFAAGKLSLLFGVAALRFDSGTTVVLEGPCEVEVSSGDEARLLAGKIVVRVGELSDGFTLETPDALILDEGTEYAVSLDEEATEVHVFEGSVLWKPGLDGNAGEAQHIKTGEARRYERRRASRGASVPLAMRSFVRSIEARVRENARGALLAYDGFENLASLVQRGRSGFGWAGGWLSGQRGRQGSAEIVDAPVGRVFGVERTGLRLMRIADGRSMRRELEKPLPLEPGDVYYLSFLVERHHKDDRADRFLQVSLCDETKRSRRSSGQEIACGIASNGFPFVKTLGNITETAAPMADRVVCLCAAKIAVAEDRQATVFLRVYHKGEAIALSEPATWTTVGKRTQLDDFRPTRARIAVGSKAAYDVDELRIGKTWRSVTAPLTEEPARLPGQ